MQGATPIATGRTQGRERVLDVVLVVAFLAALAAPTFDRIVRPEVAQSVSNELRSPAPRPMLAFDDLAAVRAYPHDYEAYFADTFGMRDRLLRGHGVVMLLGFGVSPAAIATVGVDRWLFYNGDSSVEVARGLVPFAPGEADTWRVALEHRRDYLARFGIEYVYVVAPNKETIYRDKYPPSHNRCGPTRLEELKAHFARTSTLAFVDLAPTLIAEKAGDADGDYLFYPDGTHWTERGAWVGLGPILERLRALRPAVERVPRERYVRRATGYGTADTLATQLYMNELLPREEILFVPLDLPRARFADGFPADWLAPTSKTVVDDPRLPRVVLLHDSFGPWLRPYLAEQCSELVWMHTGAFPRADLVAARPDVVVEVRTERSFTCPLSEWVEDPVEVSPAEFAALEPLPSAPDASALLAEIVPFRGGTVAPADDGGVAFDSVAPGDKVLLPAFEFPRDRAAVVRIAFASPADTTLSVWYQLAGEDFHRTQRAIRRTVAAGENEIYVALPERGVVGRLLVRLGEVDGRYVVRAVEARLGPR